MNYGNINHDTAAGRVFTYLNTRRGHWVSGWTLTVDTRTSAVSTRISEVRAQLDGLGLRIETKRGWDVENGRHSFFYRIIAGKEKGPKKYLEREQFRALGRDLFFDLECTCPDPKFIGSPIEDLMKNKVTLVGYADDNFFDNVHREPREGECRCGRRFRYQWFRDGVEAEFIDPPIVAEKEEDHVKQD